MFTLNKIPDVQHNASEEVKYKRETYCQERGINKEKPDLGDRDIKAFAKIGAYTKGVPFKKCKYSL